MNSLSVKSVRFEDDVGKVTEEAVERVEEMTEMKEVRGWERAGGGRECAR